MCIFSQFSAFRMCNLRIYVYFQSIIRCQILRFCEARADPRKNRRGGILSLFLFFVLLFIHVVLYS